MLTKYLNYRFMALAMVILLGTSMMFIQGCSENPASSKDITNEIDEPNPSNDSLNPEVQASLAKSKLFEQWINAMEPFVTENGDGTYSFDNEGFTQANPTILTGEDLAIVEELKDGIPIVNQKVQEMNNGSVAAKIWFRWYWWGYKECYSELSAQYMLDAMQFSIWGLAYYPAAKWLYYTFGYFCIYHTWYGAVWVNL